MEMEAKQELNQELQKMKSQLNQSERRNDEGNKQLKAMREELARMKQENEKLKFGGGGFFPLFYFYFLYRNSLFKVSLIKFSWDPCVVWN